MSVDLIAVEVVAMWLHDTFCELPLPDGRHRTFASCTPFHRECYRYIAAALLTDPPAEIRRAIESMPSESVEVLS